VIKISRNRHGAFWSPSSSFVIVSLLHKFRADTTQCRYLFHFCSINFIAFGCSSLFQYHTFWWCCFGSARVPIIINQVPISSFASARLPPVASCAWTTFRVHYHSNRALPAPPLSIFRGDVINTSTLELLLAKDGKCVHQFICSTLVYVLTTVQQSHHLVYCKLTKNLLVEPPAQTALNCIAHSASISSLDKRPACNETQTRVVQFNWNKYAHSFNLTSVHTQFSVSATLGICTYWY
jgi:hypothetical protein